MGQLGDGTRTSYPSGTDTAGTEVNAPNSGKTKVRADIPNDLYAAVVAMQTKGRFKKGADLASATTVTLGSDGSYYDITGTTTITGFSSVGVGSIVVTQFDGALTLTHSATFVLPGGNDITTAAGFLCTWIQDDTTPTWRLVSSNDPDRASGVLDVADGGTGATTHTDGAILLGNGTSAIQSLAVTTDGAIVIGDGTTDPTTLSAFTSSTGTLKHESGGLEADVSAVTTGDILKGSGAGSIGLVNVGAANTTLQVNSGGTDLEYGTVDTANITNNAVDETKLKDALIGDFTEVVVTASDSILLGDASDIGNTKRDTVQGILDLVSGGWTISSITADPSPAVVGTFYLADVSGGDFTITLPAASGNSGKRIGVKLITGTANTLTIDGNGSETIDGSITQTLDIQYDSLTLLCDGSNWHII